MISEKNRQILDNLLLILIFGFIGYFLPKLIGLGRSGFDTTQILQQYNFYVIDMIAVFLIFIAIVYEFIIKKGDEKYGNSIAFNSIGETPHIPIKAKFLKNPFSLFLLSLIVFMGIAILAVAFKMETFTGVGVLEQQFTVVDSVIYSSLLIPIMENLNVHFGIVFFIVLLRIIARKYNWNKETFTILSFFGIILLYGFLGLANHSLRYGESDISKLTVLAFWSFGGFITALTGSIIPFWLMHFNNNLFFDLKRYFGSDTIIITSIVIWALLIGIFIVFLNKFLYRRGSKDEK